MCSSSWSVSGRLTRAGEPSASTRGGICVPGVTTLPAATIDALARGRRRGGVGGGPFGHLLHLRRFAAVYLLERVGQRIDLLAEHVEAAPQAGAGHVHRGGIRRAHADDLRIEALQRVRDAGVLRVEAPGAAGQLLPLIA